MRAALNRLSDGLWVLLLVGIPITSFPFLAERLGNVTVSPFSLLPLALLIPLWLLRDLWSGGRLPTVVWPLLGFTLASLFSAGIAWFLPLEPLKGQSVFDRELRSLATLAIGLAFYFCAVRFPQSEPRWRLTLAGIYLGGILALIWATVQADYILEGLNNVPQELNEFHRLFSIRDLERNRATGFAFEPSWLGDQIVVLYLPLWLSAVLNGRSYLPWNIGPLSLELLLAGWSSWILIMTRSRISVGTLLLTVGLVALVVVWRAGGWLTDRLSRVLSFFRSTLVGWLVRFALVAGVVGLVFLAGYLLFVNAAEVDWRMRRVYSLRTDFPAIREQHPYSLQYEVANRFAFAERLVYWRASLAPFEAYPLTGVGPGNAGFLFETGVPAYGHDLVEIQAYLDPSTPNFPNPKNLWIRLVSETGIVGFSFYLAWLLLLLRYSHVLALNSSSRAAWIGVAGLISLAAQGVEGFSLDTFALPQVWVMNGLITGLILSFSQPESGPGGGRQVDAGRAKIAPSSTPRREQATR